MTVLTGHEPNEPTENRPRPTFAFSPSLVVASDPSGGPAEAIRALRTHLMAQHFQEGRRALAICAASRSVGCSFTAANLALALAQIGVKTLLIDADLRTPTLDVLFRGTGPHTG